MKHPVAILGSGNIGTDLMMKVLRSEHVSMGLMVGIDEASDGLRLAREHQVPTALGGLQGLLDHPAARDIRIVFDATSAKAHVAHAPQLRAAGKRAIDLTPAAVGPALVPVANLRRYADEMNVNMTTCGGQATVPIVWAIAQTGAHLHYAEIVSSISSRSAGPGTRANIDEFTRTTAAALESIGNADRGKAIIILNPAEPPLMMRNTVYVLTEEMDRDEITQSILDTVEKVRAYVPGYRLVGEPIYESSRVVLHAADPRSGKTIDGLKVTCLLEVQGAGDYLPPYAGNLDIMTSAAPARGRIMGYNTPKSDDLIS
jgi:acetaldehyde dehydrogenase